MTTLISTYLYMSEYVCSRDNGDQLLISKASPTVSNGSSAIREYLFLSKSLFKYRLIKVSNYTVHQRDD